MIAQVGSSALVCYWVLKGAKPNWAERQGSKAIVGIVERGLVVHSEEEDSETGAVAAKNRILAVFGIALRPMGEQFFRQDFLRL